jgi:hypothetical protein
VIAFEVNSRSLEITYTIDSFDMLLGVLSGFAGLVWLLASIFISDYEAFKMESSFIKSFFSSEASVIDEEA